MGLMLESGRLPGAIALASPPIGSQRNSSLRRAGPKNRPFSLLEHDASSGNDDFRYEMRIDRRGQRHPIAFGVQAVERCARCVL